MLSASCTKQQCWKSHEARNMLAPQWLGDPSDCQTWLLKRDFYFGFSKVSPVINLFWRCPHSLAGFSYEIAQLQCPGEVTVAQEQPTLQCTHACIQSYKYMITCWFKPVYNLLVLCSMRYMYTYTYNMYIYISHQINLHRFCGMDLRCFPNSSGFSPASHDCYS